MDENKNTQNDDKENEVIDPKINDKKINSRDKEMKEAEEEMQRLIEAMKEQTGNGGMRVIKIRAPKYTPRTFTIEALMTLFLNCFLIIGLNGLMGVLGWTSILDLFFYCLYLTGIEMIIVLILFYFFPTLVIRTFGLSNFIPIGITFVFAMVLPIFIKIGNIGLALIFFVIIFVVRTYLKSIIKSMLLKSVRRKINERKNNH